MRARNRISRRLTGWRPREWKLREWELREWKLSRWELGAWRLREWELGEWELGGWRADVAIVVVLSLQQLLFTPAGGLRGPDYLYETGCALGVTGCILLRRRRPQLAAVAAGGILAASTLVSTTNTLSDVAFVPVFMLAYFLGSRADLGRSAVALLLLGAGVQQANGLSQFNPFVVVITIGPWAAGLVVRSRRHLTEQLAARGRELAAERTLFAAEAVRYERARIARELHDIVAHCVSVMVIQAGAGQRLTAANPSLAAEAFDAIGESAQQATAELGRLVGLLDHDPQSPAADGIQLIGELVARACDAAYRVAQESLTNAFKHAPGAPVEVVVAGAGDHVEIGVLNGPAASRRSGLEQSGGGRGLAGMRERVTACGGEISAGPAGGGGWQVLARLPRQPGLVLPAA